MVPLEWFALEADNGEDGEYRERDYFLDNLELHEGKFASVAAETVAVGRNHEDVFYKCHAP